MRPRNVVASCTLLLTFTHSFHFSRIRGGIGGGVEGGGGEVEEVEAPRCHGGGPEAEGGRVFILIGLFWIIGIIFIHKIRQDPVLVPQAAVASSL